MRCGIYGKLPAKRDFVALGTSRDFLASFEPWLQRSVAASRASLGAAWQPAFLRAPIWRFWIGREVCGATMLGGLMPSVDGVGRYFPLALFACAEADERPPLPEFEPQDAWMSAIEDILLSALDPNTGPDALTAALNALGGPPARDDGSLPDGVAALSPAGLTVAVAEDGAARAFASLRAADLLESGAGTSYWWTSGGAHIPPRALTSPGLPDPAHFAAMITGHFEAGGQA
ncbi:type VI secretion system-associated protein TagF [Methylorubrum aminovorans]